jgi:hypothetical protein
LVGASGSNRRHRNQQNASSRHRQRQSDWRFAAQGKTPITDWKEVFTIRPWMVCLQPTPENGLSKISGADTFQVRSVSETRLVKQLGQLDDDTMQLIADALAIVLAI